MLLRLVIAVALGLALSQLATLVTTVYLHRALAHRALTLSPATTFVLRILTWVTTGIRPRQWVAVHRRHHAHTDEAGDPHSPLLEGYAAVQLNNVGLYRRAARDGVTVARYGRDLPPDRWDRVLFDHAFVGLGLGIVLLCLVLGPVPGLVAAVVHTASYLLLNAAVNAVGHLWGRQPHDNTARNVGWLAMVTAGEGWHNNHHAFPTSARLGMRRAQLDFGWITIAVLRWFGWATLRPVKVANQEPIRRAA